MAVLCFKAAPNFVKFLKNCFCLIVDDSFGIYSTLLSSSLRSIKGIDELLVIILTNFVWQFCFLVYIFLCLVFIGI